MREALVCEALRPAATTRLARQPHADGRERGTALAGVSLIEAANAEEEALAIAVAIREALERPDKTVALVTPDRALARRVIAALAAGTIAADDSGGVALAETDAGRFARLAAHAALNGLEPVTLLALLKHQLIGSDAPDGSVSALERAILRGPRPKPGTGGLAHALATFRHTQSSLHPSDPRKRLNPCRTRFGASADRETDARAGGARNVSSAGSAACRARESASRCHRRALARGICRT